MLPAVACLVLLMLLRLMKTCWHLTFSFFFFFDHSCIVFISRLGLLMLCAESSRCLTLNFSSFFQYTHFISQVLIIFPPPHTLSATPDSLSRWLLYVVPSLFSATLVFYLYILCHNSKDPRIRNYWSCYAVFDRYYFIESFCSWILRFRFMYCKVS